MNKMCIADYVRLETRIHTVTEARRLIHATTDARKVTDNDGYLDKDRLESDNDQFLKLSQ